MTIKTLLSKRTCASKVAQLLEVTEGAVRDHTRGMQAWAIDCRSLEPMKAEAVAVAIGYSHGQQATRRST